MNKTTACEIVDTSKVDCSVFETQGNNIFWEQYEKLFIQVHPDMQIISRCAFVMFD